MSIKLKQNYEKFLRDSKPSILPPKKTIIHKHIKGRVERSIKTEKQQIIPPLNTNIRFDILPSYNISDHPKIARLASSYTLPFEWDWRHNYKIDDLQTKEKKKYITIPGDQKTCGSCWAISTAGIVGDLFVATGKVKYKPNLSTTFCLSCYPQNQCNGGKPATLLQDISKSGLATNHCIDYSWCKDNKECSGLNPQIVRQSGHTERMNELIPKCGCYFPENKDLYFVTNPKYTIIQNKEPVEHFRNRIKSHIISEGPCLGGFVVFKNFTNSRGNFTKTKGVYLEYVNYTGDSYMDDSEEMVGAHAVAIIGWGIEKDVQTKNGREDVPYWYCRNSWTTNWGQDGGYFKMAMYPYNQKSQFDKLATVEDPNGNMIQVGGIILCNSSDVHKSKNLDKLSTQNIPKNKLSYFKTESSEITDISDKTIAKKDNRNINYLIVIIVIAVCILLIFILLWILMKKKSRKNNYR